MNSKALGILLAGLLAGTAADAAVVSGTWNFSAGAYSGTYSFTDFDTSATYTNSTAGGFTVTTNFQTAGTSAFDWNGVHLTIGSLLGVGVEWVQISPAIDDWAVWLIANPFLGSATTTGLLGYAGASSGGQYFEGPAVISAVAGVPEPGTLALVGLCLAGLALPGLRRAA